MIHHVVVLCDPQLFIKRRSIKQAPRQMLYTRDHAKRRATHTVICDLAPHASVPSRPSPLDPERLAAPRRLFGLPASPVISHAIFTPSWPAPTPPFWTRHPQIMREWFSRVWPAAQIREHRHSSLSRVCARIGPARATSDGAWNAGAYYSALQ